MKMQAINVLWVHVSPSKWKRFLKWLPNALTLPMIYSHKRWSQEEGGDPSYVFFERLFQEDEKRDFPAEAKAIEMWLSEFLGISVPFLNSFRGILIEKE